MTIEKKELSDEDEYIIQKKPKKLVEADDSDEFEIKYRK